MSSQTRGAEELESGSRGKSEKTKRRILDAARRLFNQRGTAPVSTNHIAAEAGISPGNLYYHFADKKEIIRALHALYAAAHDDSWAPAPDPRDNLGKLHENLAAGVHLAWEYRFFEREILALLRADHELKASYSEVYRRRLGEWEAFGRQLVAQGMAQPPRPPRTMQDLTVAIWLVAQSWLSFLDVTGDPCDPVQAARVTELVMVVLDPYLTPSGRREFEATRRRTGVHADDGEGTRHGHQRRVL